MFRVPQDLVADVYFVMEQVLAINTGFQFRDHMVMDRQRIWRRWLSFKRFLKGERENVLVPILELVRIAPLPS